MDTSFIASVRDVLTLECSQKAQQIPKSIVLLAVTGTAASHTCINIYNKDLNFTLAKKSIFAS